MAITKIKRQSGLVKWEVRVYESGRGSKRVKRVFERRVDAEKFLLEIKKAQAQRDSDGIHKGSLKDRTFSEEVNYWLKSGEFRFSASHLVRVRAVAKRLEPEIGKWTIDKFTPERLTQIQQKEKSKGYSNATVNRLMEVITATINYSAKHQRIPFNPTRGFSKLREEKKEMSFWSETEAQDFLANMNERYPAGSDKRWVYLVYGLALNTALRAGEIWGLRPKDISPDGKSLWIQRQYNRVTLGFTLTKSRKARFVPCPGYLKDELLAWIAQREIGPDDTIFQTLGGKPICHDNFSDRQFAKDLKVWGGRRIRFHDLRHTATTLLINKGVDIKTVKEVCGHADITTTMNYVHMVAGAIERLSEVFVIGPKRSDLDPLGSKGTT